VNWGGCQVWFSIDGTTYSQIGTINEPCAIGHLTAVLPANSDPDTTDTLSVDMTISQVELVSAIQQVADQFGTLCALISPDGKTVEFISYETATLTAANRYNLTYLRRGVYNTNVSTFPQGSSFVYIGSQTLFQYFYQLQFVNAAVYMKFPSFNLQGQAVQSLAQCKVWILFVQDMGSGAEGPGSNLPTAQTTVTLGTGVVNNPTEAYDANFSTFASLSVAGTGTASTATLELSGWPSITLDSPATLYIAAQVTAGNPTMRAIGIPGFSLIVPISGNFALNIPTGTNLSGITVEIGVSGSTSPASIDVYEVWIQ
jgi:hypothetical protein